MFKKILAITLLLLVCSVYSQIDEKELDGIEIVDDDAPREPTINFVLFKSKEGKGGDVGLYYFKTYHLKHDKDSIPLLNGKILLRELEVWEFDEKVKWMKDYFRIRVRDKQFICYPSDNYIAFHYIDARSKDFKQKSKKEIKDSFIHHFQPDKKNNLAFKNCIINDLTWNVKENAKIKMDGEMTFVNCAFLESLNFNHTQFNKTVAFVNCYFSLSEQVRFFDSTFKDNVIVLNDFEKHDWSIDLELLHSSDTEFLGFEKEYFFERKLSSTFEFDNCKFQKLSYFHNQVKFLHINLNNSIFNETVLLNFLGFTYEKKKLFTSKKIQEEIVHNFEYSEDSIPSFYNFRSDHCIYQKTVSMISSRFKNSSMVNSVLKSDFVFFNSVVDPSSDFKNLLFLGENKNIYTDNRKFMLDDLGVNNATLINMDFPFIASTDTTLYSKESRALCHDFYSRLKVDANKKFAGRTALLNEFNDKMEHSKVVYDIEYYWKNNMFFAFLWYGLLEVLVKNGYHGETNFAVVSLIIIFFFAIAFFVKHRKEAIRYISRSGYETTGKQKYAANRDFRTFVRCTWLSFWIFLNPRMPLSYFQVKKGVFILFVFEWLIGTSLMALFIIYIASKYPFIKALFG
ncbi:MAG: hypothetical protein QM710_07670 [Flavobacterium sp.]